VDVTFDDRRGGGTLGVEARVRTVDKTGVEMEALTAVTVAALTVYDMLKALEKGITIERVALVAKSGGKSGEWRRSR
jgi:cyclic pyranopterin phosphate synthase